MCLGQGKSDQNNHIGFLGIPLDRIKNVNSRIISVILSHLCLHINQCAFIFCSVHVVFGLVISGFEVIEQIENLKTDTASRPYADVRVIDCGVLVATSAKDGKQIILARGVWGKPQHF